MRLSPRQGAAGAAVALLVLALLCSYQRHRAPLDRPAAPIERSTPEAIVPAVVPALPTQKPPGRETVTTRPLPAGKNAADAYKSAFVLWKELTEEDKNILSHPRDEVDFDQAEALFRKIQPIMDLLRKARDESSYCDWGVGSMRFETPMPHLTAVMDLGKLANWEAAYRFGTDPAGAIADLDAKSFLARGIADQAIIGFLVDTALDAGTVDLLRGQAAELPPETLAQAMALTQSSDPVGDLQRAMVRETEGVQNFAVALSDPRTRDQTLTLLEGMLSPTGAPSALASLDVPSLIAQSKWLESVEGDFAQHAAGPAAEFDAWWARVQQEAASQPFAAESLPALDGVYHKARNVAVQRALLLAGLQALHDGPAQLAATPDPTTGRAFTYIPTDSGFELRSSFVYKNQPVSMTFHKGQ